MSPRKSSTSSAEPTRRPRYLGLEVVGAQPIPPRHLERELLRRLAVAGARTPDLRLIRFEGQRALVRIDHLEVARARSAWNGPASPTDGTGPIGVRTLRTYGTLRKGKAWLRSRSS